MKTLAEFKAEVRRKLAGLTLTEYVAAHPGEHLWAGYDCYTCCAFCGNLRRADDHQAPCRGLTKITTRRTKA